MGTTYCPVVPVTAIVVTASTGTVRTATSAATPDQTAIAATAIIGTAETTAAGATTTMGAMAVTIAETTGTMEETTITMEEVDPGAAAAAVATDPVGPAGPPTDLPPTQDGGTAEAAEILSVPEVTEESASHRSNSSTKPHCFVLKYIHKNNASD